MATKKLTVKSWNSLSEGSKKRAITCVFPLMRGSLDYLAYEKVDLTDTWWKLIFRKVRVPEDCSCYKTVINHTYIQ